jgi:hypothetical protein
LGNTFSTNSSFDVTKMQKLWGNEFRPEVRSPGTFGYSDPAPDRKTDLTDTCPCTPITRVFIFSVFYQAGEWMNSTCSVKSYCNHTELIPHRLTSCLLLYSQSQFVVLLACLCHKVICSFPFITYAINSCIDISMVTEQQLLVCCYACHIAASLYSY